MQKRLYPVFLLFLSEIAAQSPNPARGYVFDDKSVPRIDIIIHPDSLAKILAPENQLSDHEYPATFIFSNSSRKDTIAKIGFRLRGNSSRAATKKSFKVSFNTFHKGRKFHGLEKLNLNGDRKDPSVLRSKLSWDLLRDSRLPASRINHVRLYLNGNYYGIQVNVEHIDEEFILSRFGENEGAFFKCLFPADLKFRGKNGEDYQHKLGRRPVYELKRGEKRSYELLANFIDIINNEPDSTFQQRLEQTFDVDEYLRTMAVEVLIGHWDNYSYNSNNFYLYFEKDAGRAHYITYDLDATFGLDFNNIDWANRSVFNWTKTANSSPLHSRIMGRETYKLRFLSYLREVQEKLFDAKLEASAKKAKQLIEPYMQDDLLRYHETGYSYQDFVESLESSSGKNVKYGIIEFIRQRNEYVSKELKDL